MKLKGTLAAEIEPLVMRFVREVVDAVVRVFTNTLGTQIGGMPRRALQAKATRVRRKLIRGEEVSADEMALLKRYEALPTRYSMQCQHVDKNGKHCTNRSRGPRFHYLCIEHDKKPKSSSKPRVLVEP